MVVGDTHVDHLTPAGEVLGDLGDRPTLCRHATDHDGVVGGGGVVMCDAPGEVVDAGRLRQSQWCVVGGAWWVVRGGW